MTRKVSDRRIGEPKVVASIETATWRSSGANDRFVTPQSLDETPSCQSWPASHVRAVPVLRSVTVTCAKSRMVGSDGSVAGCVAAR